MFTSYSRTSKLQNVSILHHDTMTHHPWQFHCMLHKPLLERKFLKKKEKERESQGNLSLKVKIVLWLCMTSGAMTSLLLQRQPFPYGLRSRTYSLVRRLPRSSRFQPQSSHKPCFITFTFCHNMNPLHQLKRCVSMMYSHVLSCSFLFAMSLRSLRCPHAVLNVVWCNTSGFPVISKILDNHLSRCLMYFWQVNRKWYGVSTWPQVQYFVMVGEIWDWNEFKKWWPVMSLCRCCDPFMLYSFHDDTCLFISAIWW